LKAEGFDEIEKRKEIGREKGDWNNVHSESILTQPKWER
jgi:hypothetical protein